MGLGCATTCSATCRPACCGSTTGAINTIPATRRGSRANTSRTSAPPIELPTMANGAALPTRPSMAVCSQSAISGSPQACSGNAGVRPKPGRSRYIRRIESLPSNALSSIISERWSTPMPCTNTTGNPSSLPQSRSTAAIAPCVPLLQPGTNRLSHNSGSSSLGVGAIPTAILGFEGLICADVMKREDLSQSRVMTQPPFRWICHAVMMTAEPEHGKSRMLHRPAGHGQP